MTAEENYKEFVNTVCEMLGFNKSIDIIKLCQTTSDFIRPYELKIKELEKENERLAKRICELQSDLSREKSLNEKMKRCSNCVHRFVRHFSQEGTCQRPNCKKYSDWCFDGKRPLKEIL